MVAQDGSARGDVVDRLLANRIVVLGQAVDDAIAMTLCSQLLLLEGDDDEREVWLYINSPGGSVTAGMAIYDTMQFIRPAVATVAMGFAASMGQFLLCAGAPGRRFALPNSRVLMHQPSAGLQGVASDIAIQAAAFTDTKRAMAELLAVHTGQPIERIRQDWDRDRWYTAAEAREYGMVDHVLSNRQQLDGLARTT